MKGRTGRKGKQQRGNMYFRSFGKATLWQYSRKKSLNITHLFCSTISFLLIFLFLLHFSFFPPLGFTCLSQTLFPFPFLLSFLYFLHSFSSHLSSKTTNIYEAPPLSCEFIFSPNNFPHTCVVQLISFTHKNTIVCETQALTKCLFPPFFFSAATSFPSFPLPPSHIYRPLWEAFQGEGGRGMLTRLTSSTFNDSRVTLLGVVKCKERWGRQREKRKKEEEGNGYAKKEERREHRYEANKNLEKIRSIRRLCV